MEKTAIEKIDDLVKTQCSHGNWNYDPYMHGMTNGMILIQSILKDGGDSTPNFLEAPDEWLCDKRSISEPIENQERCCGDCGDLVGSCECN